jgi:phosphomannomutase/phosphoglucomutase
MLETNGSLGGEFDGHVFIGDRWYGFSDALYGCARLLELLAMASSSYADLVADLPHSIVTPMLRLPLEEGRATTLLNTLSNNGAEFSGARVTTLDGLRVDYADGWGLVRASDHEAALEFRFEGNDETSLNRVTGVLRRALADIGVDDLPF